MTKNAADYLGLDNIGSIEVGKTADLVSFDIQNDYGTVSNALVGGYMKYSTSYAFAEKMVGELT